MVLWLRRCRRNTVALYLASICAFLFLWSTLTFVILVSQEQYAQSLDAAPSDRTTEDSYMGRGIQVVVGHFNGKLPDEKRVNLTAEQLNANDFRPVDGAGEMGRAIKLSADEQARSKTLFSVNQFDLVVSDKLALNRSLPDVRKKACRANNYTAAALPDTSVIIVYHNEAWSTLLRTVTSVINRSPAHLLREVILVDDFSNRTFLRAPLDEFVARLPAPVRVLRAPSRVGLIRARLMGAAVARGRVLTFLDSHCECSDGWLEPLLARIAEDRTAAVCPVIDVINDKSFAYQKGIELFRGGFNWNLQFRWYAVPPSTYKQDDYRPDAPIKSPTMAGGLFAIEKKFFEEVGSYDNGMDIWGGENLEMSFRIWMCGGSVEILPCSHVGHIFRKASPHDFPDKGSSKILNSNLVRVAEVWMDDWKHLFYKTAPQALTLAKNIDVSDRRELRERLRCKDFAWYLREVWPEHFLPRAGQFFGRVAADDGCLRLAHVASIASSDGRERRVSLGPCAGDFARAQLEQAATAGCLVSTPGEVGKRRHALTMAKCTLGFDMWQLWIVSDDGRIKGDEHQCLSATQVGQQWFVQLKECAEYESEVWHYDSTRQTFAHRTSGLCLDKPAKAAKDEVKVPTLQRCSRHSQSQKWTLHQVSWRPSDSQSV